MASHDSERSTGHAPEEEEGAEGADVAGAIEAHARQQLGLPLSRRPVRSQVQQHRDDVLANEDQRSDDAQGELLVRVQRGQAARSRRILRAAQRVNHKPDRLCALTENLREVEHLDPRHGVVQIGAPDHKHRDLHKEHEHCAHRDTAQGDKHRSIERAACLWAGRRRCETAPAGDSPARLPSRTISNLGQSKPEYSHPQLRNTNRTTYPA